EGESVDPVHGFQGFGGAAFREDAVELRGAAAHFQRTGQHAALMKAALDTLLHHLPQMQHSRPYLLLARPGALVREHELKELEPIFPTEHEKFGGGVEWVGRLRSLGCLTGLALAAADDESAADRVILLFAQRLAVRSCREPHAVRVSREALGAQQQQLRLLVEVDLVTAEEADAVARAHALQSWIDTVR